MKVSMPPLSEANRQNLEKIKLKLRDDRPKKLPINQEKRLRRTFQNEHNNFLP
jgi:hypothetical protein